MEVKFEWSVDLGGNDQSQLISEKGVSKIAKVSIKRNTESKDLWPILKGDANENLKVWVLTGGEKLRIDLDILNHHQNRGKAAKFRQRAEKKELVCNSSELKITKGSRGEIIYSRGTRWLGWNRGFVAENTKKLSVRVSLNKCQKKDEKQIECPLKVVINNP